MSSTERQARLEMLVDFLAECYRSNWDLDSGDISDILAMDFQSVRNRKE